MLTSTVRISAAVTIGLALLLGTLAGKPEEKRASAPINLDPPAVASDSSVKIDYPIVYVRLLRQQKTKVWAQAGVPLQMNRGADLMLLKPDGSEEVLVE